MCRPLWRKIFPLVRIKTYHKNTSANECTQSIILLFAQFLGLNSFPHVHSPLWLWYVVHSRYIAKAAFTEQVASAAKHLICIWEVSSWGTNYFVVFLWLFWTTSLHSYHIHFVWTGHCYSAFPLFYQNSFQLVQMHHKHVDVEVSISSRYKLGHLSQYSDKAMGWTIGSSIASRHREFFSLPLYADQT